MIRIDDDITPAALTAGIEKTLEVGMKSTRLLREKWDPESGTPVFTVNGVYTARGWTEWTQGFQYGAALYLYEGTGDRDMLEWGRRMTAERMAPHVTHIGVHDHGFNNVSTYGNLLRMMDEGLIDEDRWEREFYRLALKSSGAVQAARWTDLPDGLGYITSFNGPHSLFSDTMRTLRALAVAHQFGHVLMGEQDRKINLLNRVLAHAETNARYNVYFGEGRDIWDERGRVVHESIFNVTNGVYRNPSTQQGYSPFSTWTRGQAWVICGYPELLEWLDTRGDDEISKAALPGYPDRGALEARFLLAARAASDHYIANTPTDGIPYWDTGAPGLAAMPGWGDREADPENPHEPVDSSAAAITALGLLRLGRWMVARADRAESGGPEAPGGEKPASFREAGERYFRAGLAVARTLFSDRYLAGDPAHQGILLHAVYHRPNGWDHAPTGDGVPRGESCFWGDYHALELAIYLKRLAEGKGDLRFFPRDGLSGEAAASYPAAPASVGGGGRS